MIDKSRRLIEGATNPHRSIVLAFNREDSKIARSWSNAIRKEIDKVDGIDLKRLRNEHAHLIAILARLSRLVGLAVPPPSLELFGLRQELISAVVHHLKSEDWVLYPRLFTNPDQQIAQTAHAFSEEMGGLAKAFTGYTQRWGAYSIEADWAGYRRETVEITRALTERIRREDRDLYPLLEGSAL